MTLLSKSLLSTSLLLSSVSTSKDIHNPNVCPSLSLQEDEESYEMRIKKTTERVQKD